MKSPYGPLLSLRELEEQQAEARLAETLREATTAEAEVIMSRTARDAWIHFYLDQPSGSVDAAGLGALLARLEIGERDAARRLTDAQHRVDEARDELLERRRQREAVETLHTDLLEQTARALERRHQAELDEVGAKRLDAGREPDDAR